MTTLHISRKDSVEMRELGGSMAPIWKKYYKNCNAIIVSMTDIYSVWSDLWLIANSPIFLPCSIIGLKLPICLKIIEMHCTLTANVFLKSFSTNLLLIADLPSYLHL